MHGLEDINGLVPSLKMSDRSGYAQITIRGIGINNFVPLAESAVAVSSVRTFRNSRFGVACATPGLWALAWTRVLVVREAPHSSGGRICQFMEPDFEETGDDY